MARLAFIQLSSFLLLTIKIEEDLESEREKWGSDFASVFRLSEKETKLLRSSRYFGPKTQKGKPCAAPHFLQRYWKKAPPSP